MAGSIYGVDVKISEDNTAYIIEINGCDSGTDFFKYEEGFSYYKSFMSALASDIGGKPIFLPKDRCEPYDTIEKAVFIRQVLKETDTIKRVYNLYSQIFKDLFYIDTWWIEDTLEHTIAEISKNKRPDAESRFYYDAAISLGIPIVYYDSIKLLKNYIEVEVNGKTVKYDPEDVGLIWENSNILKKVPPNYRHLFLNNSFIEDILSSKNFTKEYLFSDEERCDFFPDSIALGIGIGNTHSLIEFLENLDCDMVAIKPDLGCQGAGIRIEKRKDLLKEAKSRNKKIDMEFYISAMKFIKGTTSSEYYYEYGLHNFEEFVESIPVYNNSTGKYHDGCARVIVYSPQNGEPYAIGSQWRLAPEPIKSNNSLNSRFRANLSRGATAQMVLPEHKAMMEERAVDAVRCLERNYEIFINNVEFPENTENLPFIELLRIHFICEVFNDICYTCFSEEEIEKELPTRYTLTDWDRFDMFNNEFDKCIFKIDNEL
jgi:hypothetical protein